MINLLIVFVAQYAFLISIFVLVVFGLKVDSQTRKRLIILTLLSFILSYVLAKVSALFIYDPRPFVTQHLQPLFPHAPDNGFPSDHTLLSTAIASVVFAFNKRWGVFLFVLALAIGLARVLAHVHQPLDIIGSVVIAVSMTWIASLVLEKKL